MKVRIITALLATAIPLIASTEPVTTLELMPVPRELTLTAGELVIDEGFTVSIAGNGANSRLADGVRRMLRRLSDRSGIFFPSATFLELSEADATMVVTSERGGKVALGEDESYRLSVSEAGIRLTAATDIGALHGLQTFLQLVALDERGVVVPAVEIADEPRFPWRGLMIDSSRHFMPVYVLERNLDGMAAVKLNVLHWHLSDDQGFRFESLQHPKLHELGSDGLFYTRAQLGQVIDYAAARGIRVVPELDLPGHATSWLAGYPELGSQPGPYQIERSWGVHKPTVDPTRDQVYDFLDTLFGEVAEVFDDDFVHIGGDENTGEHWAANADIQRFMTEEGYADAHALQQHFSQRLQKILVGHGKRMVGWDEILQPELPTSIVIQSWRGRESLFAAVEAGYSGILSNGYYIDLIHPADKHYLNDPLPADAPISQEARQRVLGGEATMWAEYVAPETVDSRIWPRTAAIAERLWSPAEVRDVPDMYRRLDHISLMLEELGLQHESNQRMMLRRLCQCRDVHALEVLIGAIEPVKVYRRGRLRKYTSFSPLTRLVDAAWPDAAPARRFRATVERLLADDFSDTTDLDTAKAMLRHWVVNHSKLAETFRTSPALAETEPLSLDLNVAATIGFESLNHITTGTEVGPEWVTQRLDRLAAAEEPRGEAEVMIVDPVRSLVCRAAGSSAEEQPRCRGGAAATPRGGHD